MKEFRGQGISDGIAVGRVVLWRPEARTVSLTDSLRGQKAWECYLQAREVVADALETLYRESTDRLGEENAAVFDVQAMMARDEEMASVVRRALLEEGATAEQALQRARQDTVARFAAMHTAYLRERGADAADVIDRIAAAMRGERREGPVLPEGEASILCADDLTPAQTATLDRTRLAGFVTAHGSLTSHTAILARCMGVPALVGVGAAAIAALQTGDTVVLDAGQGLLYPNPDPATLQAAYARRSAWEDGRKHLQAMRGKPTVTRQGRTVQLYANAALPSDIETVLDSDAEGIGLFRSEFLYMGQEAVPDEQTQYEIYREILTRMQGRRVIIRTLDVGADKQARCLPPLPAEENPALGCRAVRYSLKYPALFLTQARALLRASVHGKLSVMFPLISSEEELRGILSLWERAKGEVGSAAAVPLGAMIETPAAALISDRLATMVDFFSIGSNDLTQYTLAMDRQNESLQPFYRPYHPAVLSLIRTTVQNAKAAGIWVGICGELGADTSLTEQFLQMGVDELSVAPTQILALRAHIATLDL